MKRMKDPKTCRQCFEEYDQAGQFYIDGFCSDSCENQYDHEIGTNHDRGMCDCWGPRDDD